MGLDSRQLGMVSLDLQRVPRLTKSGSSLQRAVQSEGYLMCVCQLNSSSELREVCKGCEIVCRPALVKLEIPKGINE
jgi:hypothetical protein